MADVEKKSQPDAEAEPEREKWGSKWEFLLSSIGYCVGLGNVWRFPYLAYQSGGGAFLIPYLIMLTLCGIPMFMMELSFGQFAGLGAVTIWRALPIAKGIGYGMVIVSFLVCIYYNVIIGWSLFYLFASMQSVLPWTQCDQWWNEASSCVNSNISTPIANEDGELNCTAVLIERAASNVTVSLVPTSEDYWNNRVLRINQSAGPEDPGAVLWDLCLCLLLAWIIVFGCLAKGVQSSGKVVYFTATFPYVILIILLVRGVTLDGAADGIRFYVTPDWERLKDIKVWTDAANQIFYSLGVAFGGLMTFASYNKFNNNIYRDTLIVSLGNCGTSIFAGFVIFSVIGHMAKRLCVDVEDVITQGPGLAFIAYPQALALLPAPQLWAILFFFMLLTLGLDSQFAMLETVVTGIIDEFPVFFRGEVTICGRFKTQRKMMLTLGLSIVAFLLGIITVTEGGLHWFNLYNDYSAYYGLFFVAFSLVVAIGWGYGYLCTYKWRFNQDIKLMIGFEPNIYFKVMWGFFTPAVIFAILIFALINIPSDPDWFNILGICMSWSVFAPVPLYALYRIILAACTGESIMDLFRPTAEWRPDDRTIKYDHIKGPLEKPLETTEIDAIAYPNTYSQNVTDDVVDPYKSAGSPGSFL